MTAIAPSRPRMRGWVHAAATPLAAVGAVVLWQASASKPLPARLSVAVFGLGLVGLFAVSALYHAPTWDERRRWLLSRADVVMIQLFIAASYTPFAVHALEDPWRTGSLVVAWTVAIGGAVLAASPIRGPRWLTAAGYVAFGWLGLVPFARIVHVLPAPGVALTAFGGLLYTLGAIVYARRRPDPWPHRFGFHEVFHVLVVVAGTAHFVAVWRYTLPLA